MIFPMNLIDVKAPSEKDLRLTNNLLITYMRATESSVGVWSHKELSTGFKSSFFLKKKHGTVRGVAFQHK